MRDDRFEKGKTIAHSCLGKAGEESIGELTEIAPVHGRSIYEYCYGTIWAQPLLSIKMREFILIAVCASQGEYDAVERQVRGALNHGATPEEVIEAITTCAPYIGFPRTNASLRAAKSVFDQWGQREDWRAV
jgi:4-carboxymuconolactone decarboxylase